MGMAQHERDLRICLRAKVFNPGPRKYGSELLTITTNAGSALTFRRLTSTIVDVPHR